MARSLENYRTTMSRSSLRLSSPHPSNLMKLSRRRWSGEAGRHRDPIGENRIWRKTGDLRIGGRRNWQLDRRGARSKLNSNFPSCDGWRSMELIERMGFSMPVATQLPRGQGRRLGRIGLL
jgi:hypothetical protein